MAANPDPNSGIPDPSGGGWRPTAGASQQPGVNTPPQARTSPSGTGLTPTVQSSSWRTPVGIVLIVAGLLVFVSSPFVAISTKSNRIVDAADITLCGVIPLFVLGGVGMLLLRSGRRAQTAVQASQMPAATAATTAPTAASSQPNVKRQQIAPSIGLPLLKLLLGAVLIVSGMVVAAAVSALGYGYPEPRLVLIVSLPLALLSLFGLIRLSRSDAARPTTSPSLVGIVKGFRVSEEGSRTIYRALSTRAEGTQPLYLWDFQVEQNDGSGNVVLSAVQLHGERFTGSIQDGQKVEVFGSWRKGTLQASKLHNVTTGAWIEPIRG